MKFMTKIMSILCASAMLCLSAQAYKLTVVNRANEPIYFKYSNILNNCGAKTLFPKEQPIKPNESYTTDSSRLCSAVCFSGIEIQNAKKQKVFADSWKLGKCKSFTLYVTNLKDGHLDSWQVTEIDPGEAVDPTRFKINLPFKTEPISPGGPAAESLRIPEELERALNGINDRAIQDYWVKHPEMDRSNKLIVQQGNILANLGFVEKYIKENPQYVDAVDVYNRTPLVFLIKNLCIESSKKNTNKVTSHQIAFDTTIHALRNTIESLLRVYRADPSSAITVAIDCLNPDFNVIQMLLYAGGTIKKSYNNAFDPKKPMSGKEFIGYKKNADDPRIYNFLTDWVRKKGIVVE